MRTFLNIASAWQLEFGEVRGLLGMPAANEFQTWSDQAKASEALTLSTDVLLRISAVLGVYVSLRILCGPEHEGAKWLRQVNRENPFNGRAPMETMLSGFEPGLMDVRSYLLALEHGSAPAPNEADRDFKPYTAADILWS